MTIVDGRFMFSNSEITTAQGCPRKWWLAWYRGLVPRLHAVQGALSTGSRLHVALAALYTPGGTADDARAALNIVQMESRTLFEAQYETDEEVNFKLAKLLSDFDLEHIMLEGYLEWLQETGIDADIEVIATETYIEAELHHIHKKPITIIGKLDARVRHRITGRRSFIDHKTVTTFNQPTLRMNRQMLHYHLLELLNTGFTPEERCDGALYNMLRKVKRTSRSKPPYYQRTPIPHNRYEINSYLGQLITLLDSMTELYDTLATEKDFADQVSIVPARPSMECSWCPFLKICSMFDDGSRVEDAIEELYEVKDPLSYYGALEKGDEF